MIFFFFQHLSMVLFVINLLIAVWLVGRDRRDIAVTWAWLMVLTFLPLIGLLLYIFFGRKLTQDQIFVIRQEQKQIMEDFKARQQALVDQKNEDARGKVTEREQLLSRLLGSLDGAILTQANQVEVFTDGEAKFNQLIEDINHATDHVHVEYYTFASDHLGRRLLQALEEAARRGVEVRVLYDLGGSRGTNYKFFEYLERLGGQAQAFISASKARFTTPRLNYHLHRKLVIIDGNVGYIGGFNVGDQYVGEDPKFGYWRDTHFRVTGSAPTMMQIRFMMDWNTTCRRTKKERLDFDDEILQKQLSLLADYEAHTKGVPMQIVSSGPDNDQYAIRRGYQNIISQARNYVYIQTPYLIPEDSILEALIIAAKAGVDVRIMIPSMPDHPFVYRATEAFARYLTMNDVKVYKYDHGFLHAKTMVSGNNIAAVGSANLDYRSAKLNFEVNAFTYDAELAQQLKETFEQDLQQATLLTPSYFANQSKWLKFKQSCCRLLAPIL